MKKLVTFCVLGAALAVTACTAQRGDANYGYEQQAPYASERTVGSETKSAEPVFQKSQHK
jgi:hypothetical protein